MGPLQQKEAKIKSQLDAQIAANNATLESLGKVNITYGLLTLSRCRKVSCFCIMEGHIKNVVNGLLVHIIFLTTRKRKQF